MNNYLCITDTYTSAPKEVNWAPCIEGPVKAWDENNNLVKGIIVKANGTLYGDTSTVRRVAYEQWDSIPTSVLIVNRGKDKAIFQDKVVHMNGAWDDLPFDYKYLETIAQGSTYCCTDTLDLYVFNDGWELLV